MGHYEVIKSDLVRSAQIVSPGHISLDLVIIIVVLIVLVIMAIILVIQLYHKLIKMQLQNLGQISASNFDQTTAINGAYQHCPRKTID